MFWIIAALTVLSTVADIESTFYTLARSPTAYEANPLIRPFVESGRLATYGIEMVVVGALLAACYHFRDWGGWWIPLALITLVHSVAAWSNIHK